MRRRLAVPEGVNDAHTIDMIAGLPEARGVTAELHSQQWYQEVAANLSARHVGIDPETGFRTIGGYWNLPVRCGRPAQHHHDHGPGQDHRDLARQA